MMFKEFECYLKNGIKMESKILITKSSCLLFCFHKNDKNNELANGRGWLLLVKVGTFQEVRFESYLDNKMGLSITAFSTSCNLKMGYKRND